MRILIAEDDAAFRAAITEVLSGAGYTVAAAPDGARAWEMLEREGADICVFDVNMPGMSGFELLRKVRADARFKMVPVLMLTIKAFVEDQIAGYSYGADDYLPKPFDNDVLVARVKALGRRILKS